MGYVQSLWAKLFFLAYRLKPKFDSLKLPFIVFIT